jgi:hypothetical protein
MEQLLVSASCNLHSVWENQQPTTTLFLTQPNSGTATKNSSNNYIPLPYHRSSLAVPGAPAYLVRRATAALFGAAAPVLEVTKIRFRRRATHSNRQRRNFDFLFTAR